MKGVSYITNEQNEKLAVQIDLKVLEKYDNDLEDLLDGIIAESKANEERVPLDKVLKNLKKQGNKK